MKGQNIGEFEELVLLSVLILKDNAYGVSVKREIEEHTGRSILLGAVHATLYRLQDKDFLTSIMGGNSSQRGDRRKRLFSITAAGSRALDESKSIKQKMWSLIPSMSSE